MLLGLSESLPRLVRARFQKAKAAQALIFSPTELAIIRTSTGIPFQLRYCPALAKKPTPQKEKGEGLPKKKFDPFENPPVDLLIAEIPAANPTHVLVLNKFPIIPEHFILATKSNKQQTHFLEQDDLEATYACLKAWQTIEAPSENKRLFAFFNSGEHSGASQAHRHLQFLPVESMKNGEQSRGWQPLIDLLSAQPTTEGSSELIQHYSMPFVHYAKRLPANATGTQLLEVYQELYKAAKGSVDRFIATNPDSLKLHATDAGDVPISYNLALTVDTMAICPRRSEGCMLKNNNGSEVGFVALNGTTLAGTLMVKFQEEYDLLQSDPKSLDFVLENIGIPRDAKKPAL